MINHAMERHLKSELDFFVTTMPDSRPADYYLGCLKGSVFMDFINAENETICLKRISFDEFGCCDLNDQAIPMSEADARAFKEIIQAQLLDQSRLTAIVKKTILSNHKFIWGDALEHYELL